jgi:hypothetical protein
MGGDLRRENQKSLSLPALEGLERPNGKNREIKTLKGRETVSNEGMSSIPFCVAITKYYRPGNL